MIRRFFYLVAMFCFYVVPTWGQVPTLVQHVACPNSGVLAVGTSTNHYFCQFPEATLASNMLVLAIFADDTNSPTFAVSDDKSNTWTQDAHFTTASGNYVAIWIAPGAAAGTRQVKVTIGINMFGAVSVFLGEFYNVATSSATDGNNCNTNTTSTSIQSGSVTPTTSGDLVYQFEASENITSSSSFTVGSQSNITWNLAATLLKDGTAAQYGVYNSTAALNPTFTRGTSTNIDSCAVFLKAASAGTAPSASIRTVHLQHDEMPTSAANPFSIQFPSSGNNIIVSYNSGGSSISSISTTPSNSFSATGTVCTNSTTTQIFYSLGATTSNSLTMSVTRNTNTNDGTYLIYDLVGSLSFDADSGCQSGTIATIQATITVCSSCLTPSTSNGIVFNNFGQDFCTATSGTAPTGVLYDSAFYDANDLNGPQTVDQNNGWAHFYNSNTSALTFTYGETCDGSHAQQKWASRTASFKPSTSSVPANQFPRIVGAS